jgi:hypothetical protein
MRAPHQAGEVVLTHVLDQAAKVIEVTALDRILTMTRVVDPTVGLVEVIDGG